MRRYWLFGSIEYYASGGMLDFKASFDSRVDAANAGSEMVSSRAIEWWHVFDSSEGTIVGQTENEPPFFVEYPKFDA